MKIVKSLEDKYFVIKVTANEVKEQRQGCFSLFLGALTPSLLGILLVKN